MARQTTFAKSGELEKRWHLIDAEGRALGRLATRVARILMGKHRPDYTPFIDCGDYVIVTNASGVVLTGKKAEQKMKLSFSGHPGGLKAMPYGEVRRRHPQRLVEDAVRRMLPKGRLGRKMIRKMKVYPGSQHPHQAQQPEPLEIS